MSTGSAESLTWRRRLFVRATHASTTRAGSSALAIFDQAIFSGTNFASALLIANYATKAQLGIWQMAMTVVLLGYFVQEALILAPYRFKSHALPPEERSRYLGSVLIHQFLLMFALQAVVLAAVVVVHLAAPQIEYEGVFGVLALCLPFVLARDAVRRIATVHFENGIAALIDGVTSVIQLGGLALLFEADLIDLRYAVGVFGFAALAGTLLWARVQGADFSLRTANWRIDWFTNWLFGRWMLASMLVSNGATLLLMPWVLAFAKGEAVTGEFAAASGVAGVTNLFVNGLGNFIGPHFARVLAQEGRAGLRRAVVVPTIGMGVGLGAATLGACFFGEQVATVLFSGKYPGVGRPIAFLFANGWMLGWGIVASSGLYAMHRPRANFVTDCVNFVAAVVALSLLVSPWGATGAAAAFFAGTFCGTSTRWIAFVLALTGKDDPLNEPSSNAEANLENSAAEGDSPRTATDASWANRTMPEGLV